MARIEVRSEIAGTVVLVPVNVGQAILQDDEIVVVECMKMEIPVVCKSAGVVVSLKVASGETVSEGDLLAVIETV
jgi:acetyl-CoA carboxylase biotin carboxyl carrier protein